MAVTRKATSLNTGRYARLYRTARWLRMRRHHLMSHALCLFCQQQGFTTLATIVDHIIPHKGDESLFYDSGNLQSLCKTCHDNTKAQIERRGYSSVTGEDGFPVDPNHPVNKERR